MKKPLSLLLTLVVAVAGLAGCGGDNDEAVVAVVTADTTLSASPTTTAAVEDVPFTFPAGVPDFGTTGTTTVAFTDTSTTPAFSIASGGNTASGTTAFGSCIFRITASTFPSTHKMAVGNTITVNPCNIKVETAGMKADSPAEKRSIALLLGSAASSGVAVDVDVNPGGQLTLNGKVAGTVTLEFVTGT
ncbi:MAG: hypothetical protein ACYC0T_16665 [Ramlibacter sp.]